VVDEQARPNEHIHREENATRSYNNPGRSSQSQTDGGHQDIFKKLSAPLSYFGGEDKNAGIAGILKSLHLEDLDSGDILLLLIILFVFLEGDNIEMVITLGLMLLLGLGEEKKEDQKE